MKKATWLLGAAAAALLASGAPLTIKADDGPGDANSNLTTVADPGFILNDDTDTATANSVAQFSIQAGKLSLKTVPNLRFDDPKISDLTSSTPTLGLVDGTVTSGAPGFDGNADKKIQVLDYRGTNKGWTLKAKLSNFSNAAATTIIPDSLKLAASVTSDNETGNLSDANIAGGGADLLSPAENHGSGSTIATVNTADLILHQTPNVTPGTYRAQIVWTLRVGPEAEAPGTTDVAGE